MGVKEKAKELAIREGIKALKKDFDKNSVKFVEVIEKANSDNELYVKILEGLKKALLKEDYVWRDYLKGLIMNIDGHVLEKLIGPLVNAGFNSYDIRKEAIKKYDCNIPWAILIDPTTACNLKCEGCWASEYSKTKQLSYDNLDKIISEGKALGTFIYLFTGGEPLMRKKDLLKLAEVHSDCLFFMFTNGTLCDDQFVEDIYEIGNISLILSIEGNEETTDKRRGKGTYKAVVDAAKRLKAKGLPFGASICCTKDNTDIVVSDEYADFLIDLGCIYAWYFCFMPIGEDTTNELMPTVEQRKFMYDQIRKWRYSERKPLFTIDFFNDSEYVGGCIAGGKQYFHINPNGDCEPCVFCHFSNSNITDPDTHMIDVLRSPVFMAYKERQPFNDNLLRPCPIRDNPGAVRKIVEVSHAKSTDIASPETIENLTDKTMDLAKEWKGTADEMMEEHGFIKRRVRSVDMYDEFEKVHVHDFTEFGEDE